MTWYEYLLEQLKNMNSLNPEQDWVKKMLGHTSYIIKTNLGIQFQASYFYGFTRSGAQSEDVKLKEARVSVRRIKDKKAQGSQSMHFVDKGNDSIDIEQLKNEIFNEERTPKNRELDDTGYETLQLDSDTFLDKI